MQSDLTNTRFELVEVADKKMLYSNDRIRHDQIPAGLYIYDLRHGDSLKKPCTLEPFVRVNFCGSVICKQPFVFPPDDPYIDISHCFKHLGQKATIADFIQRAISKIFSVVTLTAENGETCDLYASGIPRECDDLIDNDEYCDFIDGLGGQQVRANVMAYLYGDGESEPADEDDLQHVAEHFEEMYQRDELTWLEDVCFRFDVEQEPECEPDEDELEV